MPPEKIRIHATNVDAAAREIIGVLEDTSKGNVIYFKGSKGLGASSILNLVAQRLKSSTRSNKFDKVIHVDCFVWKSMRALQKAIAEELELPRSVMAIFDRCEEEDDFNGMDQGSRGVIADIRIEIFRKLYNSRFVVVFHNGSNRYIDLYECGIPVISLLSNKVLWTWHGRFRSNVILEEGEKEKMKSQTDVRLSASPEFEDEEVRDLLHEEALQVAKCTGISQPDNINHKIVMECFIYQALVAMDLRTHAPNYWICDGIIEGQNNRSAWEIGNSLKRNMSLELDSSVIRSDEAAAFLLDVLNDSHVNRWNFTTHKELRNDNTHVLPPQVTSFFLSADELSTNTTSILPVGIFQHSQSSKLRVLHLSHCTFSFASPPFVHCAQLRLLHLDHCTNITDDDEHPSRNEDMSCFQKLWVMDLRYTEWYWLLSEKMKRLMVDLRELNVEGVKHGSISDLCGGRPSLVVLRVTVADPVCMENEDTSNQAQFPNMSSTNSVTIPSYINNVLPPLLESFSFVNKAATPAKISSISFRGCSQLKSVLLRGNLGNLEELDLSGTTVKTLDLREVEAPYLKHLMLLDCEKLRAILWPPEDKMTWVLEKLQISTVQSASPSQNNWEEKIKEASPTAGSSSILIFGASPLGTRRIASFDFNWNISVADARLMWSLLPFQKEIRENYVYMEIDSSPASGAAVGRREVAQGIGSQQQFCSILICK
ncbi:hypothetical protein CFC21_014764 [Triticum aestivum]|uniref:NB-ARC domain-containing protein n=2 Tax=Triticum aestivum TaxID=4565 RepID=A0A9R1IZA4_WHEAT|nr:hypothetical protein CFC21_014593 [Triticum aestivum]KAF6998667.1 hypothetical protein CFC21_014764 [Triticum aestivum]